MCKYCYGNMNQFGQKHISPILGNVAPETGLQPGFWVERNADQDGGVLSPDKLICQMGR